MQELNREPTVEEIAARIDGMTPQRVQELQRLAMDPVSLETPAGDEETSTLGDFVQDVNAMSPEMYATNGSNVNTTRAGARIGSGVSPPHY